MSKPSRKPFTRAAKSDDRERLFVEAYLANGRNGAQAAREAGYAASSAKRRAVELLARPTVKAMLAERTNALAKKYELTAEAVIEKLAKLIHADFRELYNDDGTLKDPKDWPDDIAAGVTGYEATEEFEGQGKDRRFIGMRKKVRTIDPTSALQLAMRRLGLFEKDNEQSRPLTKVVMVPAKQVVADE